MSKLKYKCYIITNKFNGKVYIGITKHTLAERFKQHVKTSRLKNGKKNAIHNAIIKYGKNNFTISLLCRSKSKKNIFKREIEFIKKYGSYNKYGYNETKGGDGGTPQFLYTREFIESVLRFYINCEDLRKTATHFNLKYHTVFDFTRFKSNRKIDKNIYNGVMSVKANSKKRKKINKLTVVQIIKDYVYGDFKLKQLSIKYNISESNVWSIVRRQTFKNLYISEKLEHALVEKFSNKRYWKKGPGPV